VAEGGGGWKKSGQVDEIQTKLSKKPAKILHNQNNDSDAG